MPRRKAAKSRAAKSKAVKKAAPKAAKARIAPFVPNFVRLGSRDLINQVLNDATWTVITPDWGKWVKTKDDGTWESAKAPSVGGP
jgi:hypothetical protein